MAYVERVINRLTRWFKWVAMSALVAMMFLVCANVVLRLLYRPILGTYELVGFLCGATISFGLAYTTAKKGHVAVELLLKFFPRRTQTVVLSFCCALSMILLALLAWQSALYATKLLHAGDVSQTLRIPIYPLMYGLALSCGLTFLVLSVEFIKYLAQLLKR